MQTPVPWQNWSSTLLAISVLGTLLAGLALIFDGWVDALALYVVCVLVLVLLLSHFAGPRTQPPIAASVNDGRAEPGAHPAGLVLTRTRGTWPGADPSTVRAALGNVTLTD